MKKRTLLALSIFFIMIGLKAQTGVNPFEGKVFTIDNYIGDKLDNTEDLTFRNNFVEGSICVQYGFNKAEYISAQNKETGLWEFSCTMTSTEHGKMVWHGSKNNNNISGNYIWTKEGQNPIHYTFKGKVK